MLLGNIERHFLQCLSRTVKEIQMIDLDQFGVKPVLYTSTKLSDVAKEVAGKLDVKFYEQARISSYPLIKCNISGRDKERIYHLPFDQQYDRVKISGRPEMYVYTIAEAERAGFRRAWRWQGKTAS